MTKRICFMNKEELFEALRAHLRISVDTGYSYEEGISLEVRLLWDGTEITSSSVDVSSLQP
jgi:hypothetical protein